MESGLLRDSDWEPLDGEFCRVLGFTPLAGRIKRGKVKSSRKGLPCASIELQSPTLTEPTTGFITHKLDFQHLWEAFESVDEDKEVIVVWNKSKLIAAAKPFSSMMPGFIVLLCPRNAYELLTDKAFRPELDGLARHEASAPIVDWFPEVMGGNRR